MIKKYLYSVHSGVRQKDIINEKVYLWLKQKIGISLLMKKQKEIWLFPTCAVHTIASYVPPIETVFVKTR